MRTRARPKAGQRRAQCPDSAAADQARWPRTHTKYALSNGANVLIDPAI